MMLFSDIVVLILFRENVTYEKYEIVVKNKLYWPTNIVMFPIQEFHVEVHLFALSLIVF